MHQHFRLLFKLTSRSRPARALKTLRSIVDNVTSDNYRIMLSVDTDDPTVNTMEFYEALIPFKNLLFYTGTSQNKIDAINRDVNKFLAWDILVNVSDDQVFIKKGFDDLIRFHMYENFQDLDGVLHFPDDNRDDLMTMSIMGRKYYHRFEYIYYPGYKSLYSDDEAMLVARLLNKYKFFPDRIFNHEHPAYQNYIGNWDAQYVKNESNDLKEPDRILFEQRKAINFGISKDGIIINEENKN